MYCNSCLKKIEKENITYCSQCGVPICKKCANHCMQCGKELCDSCYEDNHYLCEECYKPDEIFSVIRRSHIEQYAGCPYSIYLQVILGITPPMGKHAELGIITHEIIEKIEKGELNKTEALNELQEKINAWNKVVEDNYSVITMELEEVGKNCINEFFKIKDMFGNKFKSEYNIKYSIDDSLPKISCTLDRIEWVGKDIHIHDWKTGKPMSGKKLITDLQPPLYIYGIYKEFGEYPKTFNLHYLNHGKRIIYKYRGDGIYEIETTRNTYILNVDDAIKRTKKILKDIKHKKFNMPTSQTHQWRCKNLCWFGISGKCKGVEIEQWKKLTNGEKNNNME